MTLLKHSLNDNLGCLNIYFKQWSLCTNLTKTEVSCFQLNNSSANAHLQLSFHYVLLPFNWGPKYLNVAMDRNLFYKNHLIKQVSSKLKSRNIIKKISGYSWGWIAETLRISSLG